MRAVSFAVVVFLVVGSMSMAQARVLVLDPGRSKCLGSALKVGVRHKLGTKRRYFAIRIYGPRGRLLFFVRGRAPSNHFATWRYTPRWRGVFKTVYRTSIDRRTVFRTRVVRC